jgi:hypothetical protein
MVVDAAQQFAVTGQFIEFGVGLVRHGRTSLVRLVLSPAITPLSQEVPAATAGLGSVIKTGDFVRFLFVFQTMSAAVRAR